jgi:hypothetical protein
MVPILNLTWRKQSGGDCTCKKREAQRNKVGDKIELRKRERKLENSVKRMETRIVHLGEVRQQQVPGTRRNLATSEAYELNLSWQCIVSENFGSPLP